MQERKFTLSKDKTRFIRDQFGEQARIAKVLGIKQARLSHYLNGFRDIPESHLTNLASAVDRRPSDFLEDAAEKILADQSFSLDKAYTVGIE
jgi:transcriptional regulator with XRE-family HTH domain